MKNKIKSILASICLGLVTIGGTVGCNKKQDHYELTVINDSKYGIISPVLDNETNSVTVDRGDDYTFTITPIEGYEIDSLIIDGKSVNPQSIYTFSDINSDHSIAATYTKKIKSFNVLTIKFDAYYADANNYKENEINSKTIQLSIFQIDNFKGMKETDNKVKIADFEETSIYIHKDYDHANRSIPLMGTKIEAQMASPIKRNLYDNIDMLSIGDNFLMIDYEQLERANFYFEDNQYLIGFDEHIKVTTNDGVEVMLCNITLICEANYYI